MESIDIYFYEAFDEERRLLQHFLKNRTVKAEFTWQTIQESEATEPPATFISTRTQSIIPADWAGKMDAVLSRSTGYDHLMRYRRQTGSTSLHLGYLPLYCHRAVAEQAMLLWMSLFRKLSQQTDQFYRFNRDGLSGLETEYKNLLVVGVGNIGYQVIKIGRGLGMSVKGVDIVHRHSDVEYISIKRGLEEANVIVAAMNLTEENTGYFHYKLLRKAKKKPVFVNIARGELSPPGDIKQALDEKLISGAALDVYDGEQNLAHHLRSGNPSENGDVQTILQMAEYPNVIMTPHNAFNTVEAVERKAKQSIDQVDHFLKQNKFLWPVPIESVS